MSKDLKYFMQDFSEEEIIKVPAPDRFKDDEGNPIEFEVKQLTQAEIQRIFKLYRQKHVATDKRGNPIVTNGEVAWKVDKDNDRAMRHIIVEALVYPNLKDKELMDFYKCVDVTEMPLKVFPKPDEYSTVTTAILRAIGIVSDFENDEDIEAAKN